MTSNPSPQEIRDIILNLKHPHVLKNVKLPWNSFKMSFNDWCDCDLNADIYSGSLKGHSHPQWERLYKKIDLNTFKRLANEDCPEQWACMNYQSVQNLPEKCLQDMNFSALGFDEIEHSSWWMGTKGANTSCHYDTYGCNIVVQVIGSKQWILLPNDAKLTPTRVPYEESSVYCKENFFSPANLDQFKDIASHTFRVVLKPGDILLVPPKWWHYVENLENALAINTWIQLKSDTEAQLEEALVNTLIKSHTKDLNKTQLSVIVNPDDLPWFANHDTLQIIDQLASELLSTLRPKRRKVNAYEYGCLDEDDVTKRLQQYSEFFHPVKELQPDKFMEIMKKNSERYTSSMVSDENKDPTLRIAINLINATCCPEIVRQIRLQYIKEKNS